MAFPKKNNRRLVIEGETYVWHLKGRDAWMDSKHIAIRHSQFPQGQLLLLDFYAHDFEIRPQTVREAIEFASANGWEPRRCSEQTMSKIGVVFGVAVNKVQEAKPLVENALSISLVERYSYYKGGAYYVFSDNDMDLSLINNLDLIDDTVVEDVGFYVLLTVYAEEYMALSVSDSLAARSEFVLLNDE